MTRGSTATSLNVESLESRRLLTTVDGIEFDLPNEIQTSVVQSSRRTFFGDTTEISLDRPEQTLRGGTRGTPVDVYLLTPESTTDIKIESNGEARFVLTSDAGSSPVGTPATRVTGHSIETQLQAGQYLLYAFDANPASRGYQFEILLPSLEPILEFPDVAYIGRDFDWNLNAVNAPEVWAQGLTGSGALVAVIDTGVDYRHPDLNDNIWRNPYEIAGDGIDNDRNGFVDDVVGWDFAYNDNDPSDRQGHGTHVAGTIAAERNGEGTTGVAYDATILPVKVLRDNGVGSPNSIAAGIRYAVDVGADVINLSLGGGVTRSLVGALQYAFDNDVLVVAAAGNDGASRPGAPAIYSSVLDNTISVGAHNRADQIAGFSNRVGRTTAVQIDAPGSQIASTSPGGRYRYLSGTSMAAPHVAGIAALALSADGSLSSAELRRLLVEGANQSVLGSDSVGGVNAARTVAQALQTNGVLPRALNGDPQMVLNARTEFRASVTSIPKSENPSIASAIEDQNKRRLRRANLLNLAPVPASTQADATMDRDAIDIVLGSTESIS